MLAALKNKLEDRAEDICVVSSSSPTQPHAPGFKGKGKQRFYAGTPLTRSSSPLQKMVSFNKLPGMVALCIVVLIRTLASAVPTFDDLLDPALEATQPLPDGAGQGVASAGIGAHVAPDLLGETTYLLSGTSGAKHDNGLQPQPGRDCLLETFTVTISF